jgi:hypothetical protein
LVGEEFIGCLLGAGWMAGGETDQMRLKRQSKIISLAEPCKGLA